MRTLEEKLKWLKKQKLKEISLPIDMLREAINNSPLGLFVDDSDEHYCISNVSEYTLKIPKKICLYDRYELADNNKLIHTVEFKNGKSFEMPFSYTELFRTSAIERFWTKEIYPNISIGDIYLTSSPVCYLTSNFTALLVDGVHATKWDHKVPEGTHLIVYDKKDIDSLCFTKVLYDGQMYWCFGTLLPEKQTIDFNPHYI